MRKFFVALYFLALPLLAGAKYFIGFNGGRSLLEPGFNRNWSYEIYRETCSVEEYIYFPSTYDFDLYGGYCTRRSCYGLMIFYRFGSFNADHNIEAPHPLYFNQPRQVQWTNEGYELSQGNLMLFYRYSFWRKGRLDTAAFLASGYTRLNLQLPTEFEFEETYPFESAAVKNYTAEKKGYNGAVIGGGLDLGYLLSPWIQFSLQCFYTYPIVKVDAPGEGKVSVNLGKISLTAGFKVRF